MARWQESAFAKLCKVAGLAYPDEAPDSAGVRLRMGLSPDHTLVIFKQYGEYRTGTNALRALMLNNFSNVLVLMHVLGDKHSPAIDIAALSSALRDPGADRYRLLLRATRRRPGGLSQLDSFEQMAFVHVFQNAVADAVMQNTLRFLISTRHPVSWLGSIMRFWRWPSRPSLGTWEYSESRAFARYLCDRYNTNHAAWLGLVEEMGERAVLVSFEQLRAEWERVVRQCAGRFPVHFRNDRPIQVKERVVTSAWDNCSPVYERRRGSDSHEALAPDLVELVNERIDWGLMAKYGYARLDSAGTSTSIGGANLR